MNEISLLLSFLSLTTIQLLHMPVNSPDKYLGSLQFTNDVFPLLSLTTAFPAVVKPFGVWFDLLDHLAIHTKVLSSYSWLVKSGDDKYTLKTLQSFVFVVFVIISDIS